MGDLSPHFSSAEFRCKHCGRQRWISRDLLAILERIRKVHGRPLRIVSGYRCTASQSKVNPGVRGFHPLGRAADIPAGVVRVEQAIAAGARGIGVRNGWVVHVDDRRTRRPVVFDDP